MRCLRNWRPSDQGESRVRTALSTQEQHPLKPWVEEKVISFPYLPMPGDVGRVLEQTDHPEIGMKSTLLQGGVRLNVKTTDFQANQVLVSVQLARARVSPNPAWPCWARPLSRRAVLAS